ncbi:MAG: helix-turn-helix domain-containing protein [Muribaculum sp.]|nr:helix-turn-helix domain-containing protein [Muribaculum sp.]
MANEYHLGQEIRKEVQRRGMTATEFADKLCLARQSVYDIFKKRHCATDQLATICKILNRDFFKELSGMVAEPVDEEPDVSESMSTLMPENKLHAFRNNYMFREVFAEYLMSERTKPLVVFYPKDGSVDLDKTIYYIEARNHEDDDHIHNEMRHDLGLQQWGDELKSSLSPSIASLIYTGTNYNQAFNNAIELMSKPGRHVMLYIPVENSLMPGKKGGIVYEDIAEELFAVWKDKLHFVVVDSSKGDYLRKHELYLTYRREGIFDRLADSMNEMSEKMYASKRDNEIGKILFDLTQGLDLIIPSVLKAEDETGLIVLRLNMPKMTMEEKELMLSNGINDEPRMSMWIEVRNGYIVDYQYSSRARGL